MKRCVVLIVGACVTPWGAARAGSLLTNGGFETTRVVKGAPSKDIGFGVWTLGPDRRVPAHWHLNSAYAGECSVLSDGAHSGRQFLRIRGAGPRDAHVYQPCPGIHLGAWYRVTAWVRGGRGSFCLYEYYPKGLIRTPCVLTATAPCWRSSTPGGASTPRPAGASSTRTTPPAPADRAWACPPPAASSPATTA